MTCPITNALTIDVEDYFQVSSFAPHIARSEWCTRECRVERTINFILEMLTYRMAELDKLGNPTIAFNASGIEGIKVRVTAKCDDEPTAMRILDAEETIIRGVLGDAVFGIDDQSMELVVLNQLKAKGYTLAAAESITGGILASRMTAIDQEMRTFVGSAVAADPDAGSDSAEAHARQAASQIRQAFGATHGIAIVPAGRDEAANAGTVFIAFADGQGVVTDKTSLPGNRPQMREYAVISGLNVVRRILAG